MHKSTSDKASSEGALIGKKDVGKRVIVGRVGAGTLMYVGPVDGKEGVFCGVELDRPEGKHDGTYQGVAYFHCAPKHGIFAPSYKVELLQEVRITPRREEKLVRSAMPAIAGSDMASSTTTTALRSATPSMDISMASVSSLGSSSIFDHSMIMSGSWNSDAMVNSQATYTIVGPGDRSRYQLLEEIECPSELIEVDDDTPYPPLNTSLVLEESRIGVDRLPVVDDDLSTPLVEYAPYDNSSQRYQQHQTYIPDSYPSQYHPYPVMTTLSAELPASLPVASLTTHPNLYETEFPQQLSSASPPLDRVPSRMSVDSTISDDDNDATGDVRPLPRHPLEQQQQQQRPAFLASPPEQELPPMTSTETTEEEQNRLGTTLNRSFTISKGTAPKERVQHKSPSTGKLESPKKEEKKERPKKPRPPSIRELQNAPIPLRPLKPKPPSKSQLMMEQLKASIEADKLKPKKDIKSRLHDLLAAPLPVRRSQSPPVADENQEEKMSSNEENKKTAPSSSSPNAKRRRNEPLKMINSRVPSTETTQHSGATTTTTTTTTSSSSSSRPPPLVKPRQSLLPPKTIQKGNLTMRNEKLKKESCKNTTGAGKPKSVPPSPTTIKPRLLRSGLPTSSTASTTHPPTNARKSYKPTTSMATKTQQQDDALKLKRLRDAVRGFDVLTIVFGHQAQKYNEELHAALRQNSKLESRIITLEEKYEQLLVAMKADNMRQIENVNRNHEDELNSVKERYDKQLAECKDELMHTLEEQRCIHEAEIERLSRSNQIQCANLDSKLAEAEKTVEELIRDKKNLEATLSKDTNEKVAELSKEISSLNTALEIKSTEIKTLRHLNAKLQLKVEEIPPKDIEISKLKHRVRELKALVDQKTNTEKVLTSKFEELQRSARDQAVMSESMLKENDLLRYKIEEMESSTSEGEPNNAKNDSAVKYRTPQSINMRSFRLCQSERFPSSSTTPHRYSQPSHIKADDVMTRSVVSLYLEQGRNRSSKGNIDTIYTPEGTFIAKGRGFSRGLSFDDAHDADDEGTPRLRTNGQSAITEAGDYHATTTTVTTAGAVTDSGISV